MELNHPAALRALAHYNPKIQISKSQAAFIARAILAASPKPNLLVFGLGYDSSYWCSINRGGYTLFVEQDLKWIAQFRAILPEAHVVHQAYQGWSVANSLPYDAARLSKISVPPELAGVEWDVILVDAPEGWAPETPGRAVSLFWARQLASRTTQVFVDDAERELEAVYPRTLFDEASFLHLRLPRALRTPDRFMLWISRYEQGP